MKEDKSYSEKIVQLCLGSLLLIVIITILDKAFNINLINIP